MNANANGRRKHQMRLNRSGLTRFVNGKAHNLIAGVMDAMEDELSGRGDLRVNSSLSATAGKITGTLSVTSDTANILSEELGTEIRPPLETVGRLVKDLAVRTRIVRRAAGRLK